jgi:hypothetical protein
VEKRDPGSDDLALNGTAPIAISRLATLATKDNALVSIAVIIALDYFGILSQVLTVVPC